MNTKIRNLLGKVGVWIGGVTIIAGTTVVFSGMSYNFVNSKSVIIEIGMSLVIAIGILTTSRDSLKSVAKSKLFLGWGAFMAISLIATLFSVDPALSWLSQLERGTGMFFVLITAAGSLFTLLLADHFYSVRKAVLYPFVAGTAIVGLSTIVGLTGFNIIRSAAVSATAGGGGLTGNSSYAGTLLMMGFFLVAYLFATTKDLRARIFLAISGACMILSPVILGYGFFRGGGGLGALIGDARGATISLALGLVVALGVFLSFGVKRLTKWTGRILAGAMIAITLTVLALMVVPGNAVHNAFTDEASGTRFLYWNTALRAAHDHPVLGTGPETFKYANERYFDSNLMRKTYKRELFADKPHNAYLETLVTTGVPGLVAYAFMVGMFILVLVRFARKAKQGSEESFFVAAVSGFLFAYLLNNFILFDTVTSFLGIFLVTSWVIVRERGSSSDEPSRIGNVELYARSALAVAVVAVSLAIVIPEAVKLSRVFAEMFAPLETRSQMYSRSESASAYGSALSFSQRADVYAQNYLNHMKEILAASPADKELVLKDIDAIAQTLKDLQQKYPKNVSGLVALGRLGSAKIAIENRLDQPVVDQILDAGNQIEAISPNNVEGYWVIAQAYAYEGKNDLALDAFRKAIAANPKVPESYQAVMEFAKMTGNQKLFDEMTASYQKNVDPQDR